MKSSLHKCNIYLVAPPPSSSSQFSACSHVRMLFFHCQSWFFDLFYICFKLNLQLLEREYIIKYAYFSFFFFLLFFLFFFLFAAVRQYKKAKKRNHFREGKKKIKKIACPFNYDVKRWQLVLPKHSRVFSSIVIFNLGPSRSIFSLILKQ